ncbi:CAP domain-containing protein [Lacibacter sp. H375]|uniref:CAP domain-containing protein n=1 Tax=Lacibacter sp. H375 TaxID=3133424 RepID=UPI0030C2A9EC
MKKVIFIFFVFFNNHTVYAQGVLTLRDKPFEFKHVVDSALLQQLQLHSSYKTLSNHEKDLFYWTNYFRQNPRRFYDNLIQEFLKQFPEAKSTYSKSLEADIRKAPSSLALLILDNGLLNTSKAHASDLIKRGGIISHNSFNGKTFPQRLQEAGKYTCGAENVYVGSYSALESLITLLIDHGVPDKGHRMNLLDPKFGKMGLSFQVAGSGKGVLVQDFACP